MAKFIGKTSSKKYMNYFLTHYNVKTSNFYRNNSNIRFAISENGIFNTLGDDFLIFRPKQNYKLMNDELKNCFISIPPDNNFYIYKNTFESKNLLCYAHFTKDTIYCYEHGIYARRMVITNTFTYQPQLSNKKSTISVKKKQKEQLKQTTSITKTKKETTKKKKVIKLTKFEKYSSNENRITHINKNEKNIFNLIKNDKILKELQLIKSRNNHCSKNHDIYNVVVRIPYYNKTTKSFDIIQLAVHYCKTCKKYFDFYESFTHQLRKYGISTNKLFVNYCDDYNNKIHFDELDLRDQSKLFMLGYSVGKNGLSSAGRRNLISRIIFHKLMTPSEIKNHLEFLIHFQGKNKNMMYAKKCWEEDIHYINQKIIDGSFENR